MADSHPIENWRPVVGFEGRYEVSDLGRVRSLDRRDHRGHRIPGRLLRQCFTGRARNYLFVGLHWGGVTLKGVHILVLEAFVGERPSGADACHNNGIGTDNRVTNLRWDSRSANHMDKNAHGTMMRGETHHHATLTEAKVRLMFDMQGRGLSNGEIARAVGTRTHNVTRVLKRQRWKHVLV